MCGLKSVREEAVCVEPQTIKLNMWVIVFLALLTFSIFFKEVKRPPNTGHVK